MANLRIVLTGGHAGTTGIAVISEIRKIEKLKNAEIFWIGSGTAIEGKKVDTLESNALPKLNVNFYPITAGKLQTKFSVYTIPALLKIPIGFVQAFFALLTIKPKVILSFGGFASFPVVFWAKILGIPVIIHEQTVAVGRAFKASIPFAERILLSREESGKYINKSSAEVVGNPLMPGILSLKQKSDLSKTPTLLVIGGSRGSNFLNELMLKIAESLLSSFNIIHITGEADFEAQLEFKESLNEPHKDKYAIYKKVDPQNMKDLYQHADLAVSRAGANTVSELIYAKKPTIFIPLPRTYMDEQVKNAEYAVRLGLGVCLTEQEAMPARVIEEINKLIKNWKTIYGKLKNLESPDIDASKKIANIVSEYC